MNINRLLIAGVVVYFVSYGIATLGTEVILADQIAPFNVLMRPDADATPFFISMLLGYAVMVGAFCYIFTKGYENKGIGEGVRYGLVMGILLSSTDFIYGIALPVPWSTVIANTILGLVIWLVAGVILAAIYKPKAV